MGMYGNTKAGAIGSAIGPALGMDGGKMSQDLGGRTRTATGHDLGHSWGCVGPGHGQLHLYDYLGNIAKITDNVRNWLLQTIRHHAESRVNLKFVFLL